MTHPFRDFALRTLTGEELPAETYEGKTLLLVNVASACGLTPQYTGLVSLHQELAEQGASVIGIPCNQFGAQEPGTPAEIQNFCTTEYGVDFPLLEKQNVNGENRSPLYQHLVGSGADIEWNFAKFVVDGNGKVVARFAPTVKPEDTSLREALLLSIGSH